MRAFIILTHGSTFIAKGIQIFSWIYEKFGKNTIAKEMYNHAVVVFKENGIWWYQEALSNGISKPLPFGNSSYYKEKNFVVKELIGAYTDEDYAKAITWGKSVIGVKYDFLGIVNWIGKTFTNSWHGVTGKAAEARLYCSEFAEDWFNMLIANIFPHPWEDSPMNIFDNNQVLKFTPQEYFYNIINNQ
jgi:hypothetical protein